MYSQLASRLGEEVLDIWPFSHLLTLSQDVNVLAIDYRGFGDSEGYPTEPGLCMDAQAAWDWLIHSGAEPKDIVILGHSLGTGPAAKLASVLQDEGQGLVACRSTKD